MFKFEIKVENPYFGFEYKKKTPAKPIKFSEEGIYLFGGKNQKGEITNNVYCIKIG